MRIDAVIHMDASLAGSPRLHRDPKPSVFHRDSDKSHSFQLTSLGPMARLLPSGPLVPIGAVVATVF